MTEFLAELVNEVENLLTSVAVAGVDNSGRDFYRNVAVSGARPARRRDIRRTVTNVGYAQSFIAEISVAISIKINIFF